VADAPLRCELKLVLPGHERWAEIARRRLAAQGFQRQHPSRRVQSLYLDTPDRRALWDCVNGQLARAKLRLRWYGEGSRAVAAALERKSAEGDLGRKELAALDGPLDVEGHACGDFAAEILRRVPIGARPWLGAGRAPTQWIRYRREYLLLAGVGIRATLDAELCAFAQRRSRWIEARAPSRVPGLVVVELKCDASARAAAVECAERLGLGPPAKLSKYAWAFGAAS
jgi:hypothetical protein